MTEFCQVLINAPNKKQAEDISDSLLKKKLVSGCHITKGDCSYWWNNQIEKQEYYNISAFSLIKNKSSIIEEVKKIHSDECPIICFTLIDGNKEFLNWIKENIKPKSCYRQLWGARKMQPSLKKHFPT